jgi:cohesin complex subunit SA-1/2
VVALEVETSLCEVAASVEKEAQLVGRQREGEKKRKGSAKGSTPREKELQAKAAEIRERRSNLAEYLKEFVDGVFVHRYRDLDPNIRAECVKAIGLWFKKYPGHFLDGAYLRYVGWVLSDSNTHVRLEAVRALSGVYEQGDYIGSINHFTERFKPRLLEMATSDTELPVRVAVIQVLEAIDEHSLLEEEDRDKLCLLIYDEEPKVRKAVSQFVHNVWDEGVEERLVSKRKPSDMDRTRTGIKTLATLLVKWSKTLDASHGIDEDEETGDTRAEDDASSTTTGRRTRRKEILGLVGMSDHRGRTALAVEALWDGIVLIQEWDEILDILLLDHSASEENGVPSRGKAKANGKSHSSEFEIDDAWRLEEVEETVLLEVLVASLGRVKAEAGAAKKVRKIFVIFGGTGLTDSAL